MKRSLNALVFVAALAMLISWTVWAGAQMAKPQEITVTGTVLKDGRLQDEQGQAYTLVHDENTLQLMNHVGEKVEIQGTVEEGREGQNTIKIEVFGLVTCKSQKPSGQFALSDG